MSQPVVSPGRYLDLTDETRTLLTLMKFRAVGLVHAELSRSPVTSERYVELVHREKDDVKFADGAGRLLLETVKQGPAFSLALSGRLFAEFANIFWMQVADRLITTQACDYSNFGSIRASLSGGILRLEFFPSEVLAGNALPVPVGSLFAGEALADEYTHSAMDPVREQLLDWPYLDTDSGWSLALTATALLTRGLNDVWLRFILKGILPARTQGEEDWITLLGMGAGFATYYAWTVALGLELSKRSHIVLTDIGILGNTQEGLQFTADSHLLKLLHDNIVHRGERVQRQEQREKGRQKGAA